MYVHTYMYSFNMSLNENLNEENNNLKPTNVIEVACYKIHSLESSLFYSNSVNFTTLVFPVRRS